MKILISEDEKKLDIHFIKIMELKKGDVLFNELNTWSRLDLIEYALE
jgi:predicted NUDIX family phosphoesterase